MNESLKYKFVQIAKKHNLKLLILFGSRATEKFRKDSDWDLAYNFNSKISIHKEIKFLEEIEELMSEEKLNLINLDKVNSLLLLRNIFLKGICLYEKNKGLFDKELMKSWFDYEDFKYYYTLEEELIKKKIEAL